MKQELIFDLLNRALQEEMGLVVSTNNPHALTMKLHEVKSSSERFASLQITVPSTPETVMIVKKTVELDEPVYGDLPDV